MIDNLEKQNLNWNVFSVYDYNALTIQELLSQFFTKINECIDVSNKGLNILEWIKEQGLSDEVTKLLVKWTTDGTLATIINEKIFNELNDTLTNVADNIPYRNFRNGERLQQKDDTKIYEGKTVFASKTYGRYEHGAVMSAIAGEDEPTVEVLGTDTKGLSKYESRDSVAFYFHNNSESNDTYNVVGVTFNINGCTLPLGIDTNKIKVGMIIDTTTSPKCVGIIKEIQGNDIILEDGWYKIIPGVGSTVKTIPTGNTCIINPKTKVWGTNGNVFIGTGVTSGVNMELGVFCTHTEISDVGGIDLINFEGSTHYGYRARGRDNPFQKGYISEGSGVHFEGNGGDSDTPLIQAVNKDGTDFVIKNSGELSKMKVVVQTITNNTTLANNASVGLISGSNVTVSLPTPERGKMISFYSLGNGNKLLASPGQSIVFPGVSHQEIPLTPGGHSGHSYCQLVCDGTNWYSISSNIHLTV